MDGLYNKDVSIRFERRERSTRANQNKLYKERYRTQRRLNQFKMRVVDVGNSLLDQIVKAPSLKRFV